MIASERFEKIVQIVDENGIANTRDLARMMDVTETTIRRDCEELEKQGKLLRVHGGAKSVNHKSITSNRDEKDVRERTEHYEEKFYSGWRLHFLRSRNQCRSNSPIFKR